MTPCFLIGALLMSTVTLPVKAPPQGYYRSPTIRGSTMVFVAEGDLWKVPVSGGVATRLTSHPADESSPSISPDGRTVAFIGQHEGAPDVYTIPVDGGLPIRRTFDCGGRPSITGWAPGSNTTLMCTTTILSTLPNTQLTLNDVSENYAGRRTLVPLAQASDGVYGDDGVLYFTRLPFQGSFTKRYKGGTAQQIWSFKDGDAEARPLTTDFAGTSKRPMWWQGRVYFLSDRDGAMNLWSMLPDGSDCRQQTEHRGFDAAGASQDDGRIVYQLGADIHLYDIASDGDRVVPITLDSDLDQMRENWVEKPMDYATSIAISPDGDRAVITARGRIFVAPHRHGRLVEATPNPVWEGVRCRNARFMPDGKSLMAFCDKSGEVEIWRIPADGIGESVQLTTDGQVLRWEGVPSPDGKWIAHHDKNQQLWLVNVETRENKRIDECPAESFDGLAWSPDSRWLAYTWQAANLFRQVRVYSLADGAITNATSDRFDSFSPAWSTDGKWLYVLSDRHLESLVAGPWGNYQPEPFLANTTQVFAIALKPGLRSPFRPKDELETKEEKQEPKPELTPKADASAAAQTPPADAASAASKPADATKEEAKKVTVEIELAGLAARIEEIPVPAGNYGALSATDKALFFTSSEVEDRSKASLAAFPITNDNPEIKTVVAGIDFYDLSGDGKKILIRKGDALSIIDANAAAADLDKKGVNLAGWTLSISPREEWRQMFVEAWRLERDYFYDTAMHGVDWKAMLTKYMPLVDRVTTRAELSDLISQMVGELSALHIFVNGGDMREGPDRISASWLGARLDRNDAAGGYTISHIYKSDPDETARRSPLLVSGGDVREGQVISMVNGVSVLSVPDIGQLLRGRAGKQVRLRLLPGTDAQAVERDIIVVPLTSDADADLRYHEWQYTRRLKVEELSGGRIGYVHLRAMGRDNYTEWAKGFYPVFNKEAIIIDVRHNRGGNIDSWILEKLLRKAWFSWSGRVGKRDEWNMQYAFRGHVVALCNERTASDGEAFSEGIKRLNIGTVIGTRTWGGEIWLSSSNFLVDKGIATAAEFGVYGPEGEWLIEGHGVEPDVVVDNPPHATFLGQDAQLAAAVEHLLRKIEAEPVVIPAVPPKPDKSFK